MYSVDEKDIFSMSDSKCYGGGGEKSGLLLNNKEKCYFFFLHAKLFPHLIFSLNLTFGRKFEDISLSDAKFEDNLTFN